MIPIRSRSPALRPPITTRSPTSAYIADPPFLPIDEDNAAFGNLRRQVSRLPAQGEFMISRSDCCGASAQDKSVRLREEQVLMPVVEPANQVRRTSVCLPDLQDLADSVPPLRQETGDNDPIPNFCMHRLPANPPLRLAKASRKWREDSWMPSPPPGRVL